ncbi:uncharacterized protein LOC128890043 isoform X2 [Hylaeus anthracinus]|uniref:uncharacterized protein LOC128890043 isoform X2 n=1 Tax=Hylaeus anthracinus TaxID=313031 RepID=UPI0023B89D2C|nr:uncharacterized protein LOC128890043 isoform X2 [Hylaeus anthracinus]
MPGNEFPRNQYSFDAEGGRFQGVEKRRGETRWGENRPREKERRVSGTTRTVKISKGGKTRWLRSSGVRPLITGPLEERVPRGGQDEGRESRSAIDSLVAFYWTIALQESVPLNSLFAADPPAIGLTDVIQAKTGSEHSDVKILASFNGKSPGLIFIYMRKRIGLRSNKM